jgi:hypothetical protein
MKKNAEDSMCIYRARQPEDEEIGQVILLAHNHREPPLTISNRLKYGGRESEPVMRQRFRSSRARILVGPRALQRGCNWL